MIDWHRIFPNEDYRFRMAIQRGDATAFFAPSEHSDAILNLRREMLLAHPQRYAGVLQRTETQAMLKEAVEHMAKWSGKTWTHQGLAQDISEPCDALNLCLGAGGNFEPDWILLSPDAEYNHPVIAGAVCFPSSWSLAEKIGQPVFEVHQNVPTLNEELGRSINTLLNRLAPNEAWQRNNWGLSANDALDNHPETNKPRLTNEATLSTTWLRLEDQILIRLPATRAILFAIHVSIHRLDTLASLDGLAPRIARALHTMPEQIAAYKGLLLCQHSLAEKLGIE